MVFNGVHLNSNAATNLGPATGNVLLHSVCINTKGASSNTLTLADGNGTFAVIDTTSNVGHLIYDRQCVGQLIATLATGTAADVTINFG